MPLKVKVENLIPDELLDDVKGEGLSRAIADFAQEEIEDAKATNRQALGYDPPVKIFVERTEGAALKSVKPNGVIIAEFKLMNSVLSWIYANLVRHSPIGPDTGGHYYQQHSLYADGQKINPEGQIPAAAEYVFINAMPYARKLETGSSSKAPNGVYQVVATLAQREFRNEASITFAYRMVHNPSIIVRPK
jgi:hypothetical protein